MQITWQKSVAAEDSKVAEDADVSALFLDGLTGSDQDLEVVGPLENGSKAPIAYK